jgi:hypothetical protein
MDVTMRRLKVHSGKSDLGTSIFVLTEFQSSMGQNLATLLAPEGITVNTVSPIMSLNSPDLTI